MMKYRSKLVACAILLAGFHVAILLAGFFAPYGYATQNREMPYMPPSRLHLVDAQGTIHLRPFVYGWRDDGSGALQLDSTQSYPIHFFFEGSPYNVAGLVHSRMHLFGVAEPGRVFLLGTDGFGRDQFSRFLYGGQVSLLAGLIAAALSVSLGVLVGALAGFYGGWIDETLMRCGELFLALPWLYLLFAVRAAMPLHITQWQVFLLLVAVMGLIGWARPARLVRGIVLSAKERNFVVAARGFGASNGYLIRRHVMPQASGVALTQVTLLIPQYVLAEVTLTFLGLGVSEPMPSWGSLLSALQQYYVLSSYWWMFLPAALLIPLFLAYYLAADALQEHWKPVSL
jgi:peptide/nickel transport system permease protein